MMTYNIFNKRDKSGLYKKKKKKKKLFAHRDQTTEQAVGKPVTRKGCVGGLLDNVNNSGCNVGKKEKH